MRETDNHAAAARLESDAQARRKAGQDNAMREPSRYVAWTVCGYYLLYLGWLYYHQESEIWHWLSLVLVPLLMLAVLSLIDKRGANVLRRIGIVPPQPARGLLTALLLGLAMCGLQLWISNRHEELWAIVTSGRIWMLLPAAVLLMTLTAGFTEEFFFRGVLQSHLCTLTRSPALAVVLAALAFGVYHIPYAMFNPHWPSHGDWLQAVELSLAQGVPTGLVLGFLYNASRRNLWACILLHAMIDAMPAMLMLPKIHFGS